MPLTFNGSGMVRRDGLGNHKMNAVFNRPFVRRKKRGNTDSLDTTGSLHGRRQNKDLTTSNHSSHTAGSTSFLNDTQRHLENRITEESCPFLYPLVKESKIPPVPLRSREELRVGELLKDGNFCQWYNAKLLVGSFRRITATAAVTQVSSTLEMMDTSSDAFQESKRKGKRRYIVKYLHPRLLENNRAETEEALEQTATRIVIEGLYLAHLDHEFIAKLRGFSMGGLNALLSTWRHDSLFLLIDQMNDTLDKRMETWKAIAAERAHKHHKADSLYPDPLVPTGHHSKKKSNNNKDPTIETYPEDLVALKTNYALQILHALEYLHERGIVVRELRPESIAFLEYPNHHTVQLCDLSSCVEIPRDQKYLPPAAEKTAYHSQRQNLHRHSSDHSTFSDDSQQSKNEMMAYLGVNTNVGNKRYMAPELFSSSDNNTPSDQQQRQYGYTTKADIYSWAMIVTELLTDSKPYSSRQIYDEWHRIERGKVRPVLKKYHFPRSLQGVIETAWDHHQEKRPTAKTLKKQVSIILNMLEGHGLPWNNNNIQHSKEETTKSLPDRAAEYVHTMGTPASESWSQIWNRHDRNSRRQNNLHDISVKKEYQAELDKSCVELRQRHFKQRGHVAGR